jgi:hypothetical protein
MPINPNEQLVKMSFGQGEIFLRMPDKPTSHDFISLLPLYLTLEDFNRTEKNQYSTQKAEDPGCSQR